MKFLYLFLLDLYKNKALIWELTKKDLRQRYLGSYLGILWAFIQPTITVLIFWFVFQVGFKVMPVDNFPFVLWLCCGMFPWFFFTDAWSSATGSIISNSYLVKKVVFRVALLPIIQIMSALIVNIFFCFLLFMMFAAYGYTPNMYNLQIVYYLFATVCLVFGLSLISSSLAVFSRDVGQFVGMFIQFGFWATPIFWNLDILPSEYQGIFKLNPMYYVISGYRDAFIHYNWFWESSYMTMIFWIITILLGIVGMVLFKKLRPHFADIL